MIPHRAWTWLTCRVLDLRCAITGHNYGQHFTTRGLWGRAREEVPWCNRCGGEQK